jgi:hypothetical protein
VGDFSALPEKGHGILGFRPRCRLSALISPLRLGLSDARTLPFKHHLALELGHHSKHVEYQTPGGSTGVYWVSAKVKDAERHALRFKLVHQLR